MEELLRLTSPVQGLCRVATRDVAVRGTPIAEGDRVLLRYAAADRDPEDRGPDAEELDVGRAIPRLLTFSTGAQLCLGAAAAACRAASCSRSCSPAAREYLPFDPGPGRRR